MKKSRRRAGRLIFTPPVANESVHLNARRLSNRDARTVSLDLRSVREPARDVIS